MADEIAGEFVLDGEGEGGFEDVGGQGIIAVAKLHEVGEDFGPFGVGGLAEVFLEAAPGLTGLEGAFCGVRLFGDLGGVGEGEFSDPGLEEESGDIEGGALLNVEFGGVVDGLHEGERTAGRDGIDDARGVEAQSV